MYSEAKKLHLIEKILKVKSESIWIALENVLKKNALKTDTEKTNIYDFVGILSDKEAEAMKNAIAEACETIDENDWK
jgi:hypothetical protein